MAKYNKHRLEPGHTLRAMKEGREARKEGKPRNSPYEGIKLLQAFHQPWLNGWDAMDALMQKEAQTEKAL